MKSSITFADHVEWWKWIHLSVIPDRTCCSFWNVLRKFPLLWRVDLTSLSQFDFKTGNFILIRLALLSFCNSRQNIKGGAQILKMPLYIKGSMVTPGRWVLQEPLRSRNSRHATPLLDFRFPPHGKPETGLVHFKVPFRSRTVWFC